VPCGVWVLGRDNLLETHFTVGVAEIIDPYATLGIKP
jgi:hypothetical protein